MLFNRVFCETIVKRNRNVTSITITERYEMLSFYDSYCIYAFSTLPSSVPLQEGDPTSLKTT